MNGHELMAAWAGITLDIGFGADTIFAHSQLDMDITLDMFGVPTPEERAAGRARRVLDLTADEVWRGSHCTDCGLPLTLHPEGRRRTSGARYCRAAKRHHGKG